MYTQTHTYRPPPPPPPPRGVLSIHSADPQHIRTGLQPAVAAVPGWPHACAPPPPSLHSVQQAGLQSIGTDLLSADAAAPSWPNHPPVLLALPNIPQQALSLLCTNIMLTMSSPLPKTSQQLFMFNGLVHVCANNWLQKRSGKNRDLCALGR